MDSCYKISGEVLNPRKDYHWKLTDTYRAILQRDTYAVWFFFYFRLSEAKSSSFDSILGTICCLVGKAPESTHVCFFFSGEKAKGRFLENVLLGGRKVKNSECQLAP